MYEKPHTELTWEQSLIYVLVQWLSICECQTKCSAPNQSVLMNILSNKIILPKFQPSDVIIFVQLSKLMKKGNHLQRIL